MTSDDRFDRRLESSVADLAAPRFPDYFDDVLAVTGRTRQRPAWTFPGRWIPMVDISRQRAIAPGVPWRALGILVTVLLVVLLAVATIVGSQRRVPAPFGVAKNGLIAHTEASGGLYLSDPATGASRLVIPDAMGTPAFSLDGTRVAFERRVGAASDVLVADADGSHVVNVTNGPLADVVSLDWAPDGRSLAIGYVVNDLFHTEIARTDGSGVTQLDLGIDMWDPTWRPPDGRDLLFVGLKDGHTGMYLVRPDGSDLRWLGAPGATGDKYDLGQIDWSPDGSRIAYVVDGGDPYQSRVHAINADGSGHMVLSTSPAGIQDYWPIWSPDGRHLAVYRWKELHDQTADRWIAIIPADGSSPGVDADNRANSTALGGDWSTIWSPDGSQIIGTDARVQRVVSIDPVTGRTTQLPWTTIDSPTWQRLAP